MSVRPRRPRAGRPRAGRARAGFTLVELLVTMGIVGLLAAVAVPAVMHVRAAARRADCANRLHNIGLALHGHHELHGRFPAAHAPDLPDGTGRYEHSPFAHLLPHLEQHAIHDLIDFGTNDMRSVERLPVPQLVCPADRPRSGGACSYRVNLGPTPYWHPNGNGAFQALHYVSAADFTDGLSQTAGVSEVRLGDGNPDRFDPRRDMWYTALERTSDELPAGEILWSLCAGAAVPTTVPHHSEAGWHWVKANFHDTWYNHLATPNHPAPHCSVNERSPGVPYTNGGHVGASSRHDGGVNLLLMDGAVRFAADAVDRALWQASATRSGGD